MENNEWVLGEVAYALPDKQLIVPVKVKQGATLFDAVVESGIVDKFPDLSLDGIELGIFGKFEKNAKTVPLKPGDRVEIYRPLIVDPKEVRKRRAEQAKAKKQTDANSSST